MTTSTGGRTESLTIESLGPNGENSAATTYNEAVDAGGEHLFFQTYARLVPDDTDDSGDIYERSGGTTRLASTGPSGGNGPYLASVQGLSADGSHVSS